VRDGSCGCGDDADTDVNTDAHADTQRPTDGRTRRWSLIERYALSVLAAATLAVLLVAFYYPVGTVLVESVVVDGRLTLERFGRLFRDPFYFGTLARLFAGERPAVVARALLSPDRRLGLVGFTAYQAVLSTLLSVALSTRLSARSDSPPSNCFFHSRRS